MPDKVSDPIKWLNDAMYKVNINHMRNRLRGDLPAIGERYDELNDIQKRAFFDCICEEVVYKDKVDEYDELQRILPEIIKSDLHQVVLEHVENLMDYDDIGD